MTASVWSEDWPERLLMRAKQLGFSNVNALVSARAPATFAEIAKELGDDVAAAQVAMLLRHELEAADKAECLLRLTFIAAVRTHFPKGWDDGEDALFRRASVYANWLGWSGPEQEARAEAAWARFTTSCRPPRGWKPAHMADPILDAMFAEPEAV